VKVARKSRLLVNLAFDIMFTENCSTKRTSYRIKESINTRVPLNKEDADFPLGNATGIGLMA
jgi:hypothetical protein